MKHGYKKDEKHGHKKVKLINKPWKIEVKIVRLEWCYIYIYRCMYFSRIYLHIPKKIDIYMQANRELSYQIEI